MHIEIPVNEGSVVCTAYSNASWTFTTIEAPWDFSHQVSGNREFGYTFDPNDGPIGSYTFYVRGVDRFESQIDYGIADDMFTGQPFLGSDDLWLSFQQKLQDFINNNNGVGNRALPFINRPNWEEVKDVLLGNKPISDLGCN